MKKWMILLLTLLVVIAGAFLPEILLKAASLPELDKDYPMPAISSQSSSGYTWRMERIAEHYFGEGENLLSTYISEETPEQGDGEGYRQFAAQLNTLSTQGVIPEEVSTLLESDRNYRINYFYLFDTQAVSGFRIAEFSVSDTNWHITACIDMESGLLAKVEYGGSRLIPGGAAYPKTSWYDVLRDYAEYLGLSTTPEKHSENTAQLTIGGTRQYYEEHTADKWRAKMASGDSAWMELRVIRSDYMATIAVYNGGT